MKNTPVVIMTVIKIFLALFCLLVQLIAGEESDVGKTPVEMIANHGFPVETHYVTTDDGYILAVYRIPHGRSNIIQNEPTRPSVLVFHGLILSAADFVCTGPRNSLSFFLADSGYDVWLLNARGNSFSRNHTSINPDLEPAKFFNFSWHEIGIYDVPNTIDYILSQTNQEKLFYIGHSQGATTLFVMISMKPKYNEKIRFAALLAPGAFLNECALFYRLLFWKWKILHDITKFLHIYEIFGKLGVILRKKAQTYCREGSIFQEICFIVLFVIGGKPDFDQINKICEDLTKCHFFPKYWSDIAGNTFYALLENLITNSKATFPTIFTHFPNNAAVGQIIHFGQIMESGIFRQYDFGKNGNLDTYGSPLPPAYNLSQVSIPTAIFYGKNDIYISVKMAKKLIGLLPNVVYDHEIPYKKFNHIDHLYAMDILEMVYNPLLQVMKNY